MQSKRKKQTCVTTVEEALNASEAKYRSLFENATDVILTGDLQGKITSINRAVERYGFKKEQILGRNIREFLAPRSRAQMSPDF